MKKLLSNAFLMLLLLGMLAAPVAVMGINRVNKDSHVLSATNERTIKYVKAPTEDIVEESTQTTNQQVEVSK